MAPRRFGRPRRRPRCNVESRAADDSGAELERETGEVVAPGEERRRQVAVQELHVGGGAAVVGRVIGVAVTLAIGAAVLQLLALLLGLDLLGDLCRAAGICG